MRTNNVNSKHTYKSIFASFSISRESKSIYETHFPLFYLYGECGIRLFINDTHNQSIDYMRHK